MERTVQQVSSLENMAAKTSLQMEKLELTNRLHQNENESLRKAYVHTVNDSER